MILSGAVCAWVVLVTLGGERQRQLAAAEHDRRRQERAAANRPSSTGPVAADAPATPAPRPHGKPS